MALVSSSHAQPIQFHKLTQYTYINAFWWLPHLSTFTRHIFLATYDYDTFAPSLRTLTFSPSQSVPSLTLQASLSVPSRITSLKTCPPPSSPSKPLIAAATCAGSALFYSANLISESLIFEFYVPEKGFHLGAVSAIVLNENGLECVSVGEDGRINLVSLLDKMVINAV